MEVNLAKAEIFAGICGFTTTVETETKDDMTCKVSIKSECAAIQKLAGELTEVNPYREISFRGKGPTILETGSHYCTHPACPVPTGIIKAVEVAAGLALPQDVTIKISK